MWVKFPLSTMHICQARILSTQINVFWQNKQFSPINSDSSYILQGLSSLLWINVKILHIYGQREKV